jgi:hypothetical protein
MPRFPLGSKSRELVLRPSAYIISNLPWVYNLLEVEKKDTEYVVTADGGEGGIHWA